MSKAAVEGHLRFVTRVYRLRLLGLALGALPVASVLYQLHAAWWLWGLLGVNALVWPHLAHLRASGCMDCTNTGVSRRPCSMPAARADRGATVAVAYWSRMPAQLSTRRFAVGSSSFAMPPWNWSKTAINFASLSLRTTAHS